MQNKVTVTIEQVANGYIVKPAPDLSPALRDMVRVVDSPDDTHVFETFDGLSTFLRQHFEFTTPIAAQIKPTNL